MLSIAMNNLQGVLLLTVILIWGHAVCEENLYFQMLARGFRQPHEPVDLPTAELHDLFSQIGKLEVSDVANLLQSTHVLQHGAELLTPNPNITLPSPQCANDTVRVLSGLLNKKTRPWALQMLDATGKPGSGLLPTQAKYVFLGTYEECVAVKATQEVHNITSVMFNGKYCKASIPLKKSSILMPGAAIALTFGLCFPDSCSGEDVTIIMNGFLDLVLKQLKMTIPLRFGPTLCQDEHRQWDAKAVVVFVITVVFMLLMAIGTIYDIVFIQLPVWFRKYHESELIASDGEEIHTSVNIRHEIDEAVPLLGDESKMGYRKTEPSLCGKILLSFSVYTNTSKILNTKQTAGSLTAVHGIRFLSMSWVILGHTFFFSLYSLDNFATYFPEALKRFTFQGISGATVSVDSFFVLSGLLVTYLVLKEMKRKAGKINWFMFYFHRFWRLTPPYMLLMMVYVPLFPYLTTGPLWPQSGVELNQCRDTWWTNLLYINNLVRTKEMCMGWSWYLANDMQFYILSPLIFVPLFFSSIIGSIAVVIFLLATMITAGVVSRVHEMGAGLTDQAVNGTNSTQADPTSYFFDYYITPYCRMGPYIIGMVTGYLLYKTDCRIRLNKWIVLTGWCVATASALAVVYGLYDTTQGHPLTLNVAAFYNAVSRTVWGVCLCWVIFACATGHGGIVNTILSWPALIPLSRLTYCAYLVHPIVMYFFYLSQRTLTHITDVNVVYWFFGHMMASYMAAFVLSLAFEAPMMGLEKALLKREKNS